MTFNVAVEGLIGLIPLAGDVFDAAWKANQRNVRLLADWVDEPRRTQHTSAALVWAVVLLLFLLVGLFAALGYSALRWLLAL
jgi:hypothetical protein